MHAARRLRTMPTVALVGAPNTGKSTLFNRLVVRGPGLAGFNPRALTSPMAGTTRDRLEGTVSVEGAPPFRLVDTGGVERLAAGDGATIPSAASGEPIERLVEAQVLEAVEAADCIVFLVDALAGVTPADERLAPSLRRLQSRAGPPQVVLAVNKVDHSLVAERCSYFAEFWSLGLGEPRPLSAYHGSGVDEVLEAVAESLPLVAADETPPAAAAVGTDGLDGAGVHADDGLRHSGLSERGEPIRDEAEAEEDVAAAGDGESGEWEGYEEEDEEERGAFFRAPLELKLAVVGRPNVGKSSLVNRLLGAERMVVHAAPGTTRDAVTAPFAWRGRQMLLADCAGIRRRAEGGASREDLDRMAVARARQMILSSHVALLMYDAHEGVTRGDMRIADLVIQHSKSCVLVANKCDQLDAGARRAVPEGLANALPMLWYAPLVQASALHGEGVQAAMDLVVEAARWRQTRVPEPCTAPTDPSAVRAQAPAQSAPSVAPLSALRCARVPQARAAPAAQRALPARAAAAAAPKGARVQGRAGRAHPHPLRAPGEHRGAHLCRPPQPRRRAPPVGQAVGREHDPLAVGLHRHAPPHRLPLQGRAQAQARARAASPRPHGARRTPAAGRAARTGAAGNAEGSLRLLRTEALIPTKGKAYTATQPDGHGAAPFDFVQPYVQAVRCNMQGIGVYTPQCVCSVPPKSPMSVPSDRARSRGIRRTGARRV